jgi:hypothetical protein
MRIVISLDSIQEE